MIRSNCIESIMKFPGGEIGVTVDSQYCFAPVDITAHMQSSDDIMTLILLVDAIRRENPVAEINLFMPYVPYARQDRVCNRGESLSITVFANLINSLKLDRVTILDPHSAVTAALFHRLWVIEQTEIFSKLRSHWGDIWVVAPDLGASKKAEQFAQYVGAAGVVQCTKVRNLKTGKLSGFSCLGDVTEKNLFIIDDICDGGGTFVGVREVLSGAARVELAVTHGIFSKGVSAVETHFDAVYTTNSFSGQIITGLRTHCIDVDTLI